MPLKTTRVQCCMQASALDGAFCLCLDALVRSHLCRCARLKKQSPKPFCSLLFNYRNLCRVCRCCRCCFLQSFFFFSVLSGLGFHSRCIWPRLCVWVQRDIYEAAPCWKAFCVDIRGAVRQKEKGLHQSRSERGEAIIVFYTDASHIGLLTTPYFCRTKVVL